jgi:hypothetical protein
MLFFFSPFPIILLLSLSLPLSPGFDTESLLDTELDLDLLILPVRWDSGREGGEKRGGVRRREGRSEEKRGKERGGVRRREGRRGEEWGEERMGEGSRERGGSREEC